MDALAARTVPEARVSVRPRPERVCPQQGCKGVSLGAVLGHQEGGCFAVALIGAPNGGSVQLVPWAGKVLAPRGGQVPFRSPPESRLMVTEFVPCQDLLGLLDDGRVQAELAKATALANER